LDTQRWEGLFTAVANALIHLKGSLSFLAVQLAASLMLLPDKPAGGRKVTADDAD
jgi:hypothetical protein